MRRFIIGILLACLITPVIQHVHAIDTQGSDDTIMLKDVLLDANKALLAEKLDPNRLSDKAKEVEYVNKPILVAYSLPLYAYAEKTYDEILSYFYENEQIQLIILEDPPIRLGEYAQSDLMHTYPDYQKVPAYVQDVINGAAQQTFLGSTYNITNVLCFEGDNRREEAAVIYETDGGVFVRCYEYSQSAPTEFAWDQYQQLAVAYWAYATSYENNYNSKGEALSGGSVSFLDFAKDPSQYTIDTKQNRIKVVPLVCALVFLSVASVSICYYLKKRRKGDSSD